jgi:hypothetical protein
MCNFEQISVRLSIYFENMSAYITDFLLGRTLQQLQNYCGQVTVDERTSSEVRDEANRTLVMLRTVTAKDNVALKARAIDFLTRTMAFWV